MIYTLILHWRSCISATKIQKRPLHKASAVLEEEEESEYSILRVNFIVQAAIYLSIYNEIILRCIDSGASWLVYTCPAFLRDFDMC